MLSLSLRVEREIPLFLKEQEVSRIRVRNMLHLSQVMPVIVPKATTPLVYVDSAIIGLLIV